MFDLESVKSKFSELRGFDLDYLYVDKDFHIEKVLIENELKKILIESLCQKFLKMVEDKVIVEYDPLINNENEIDSICTNRVSKFSDLANFIYDIETISEMTNFEELKNKKFYIIVLKKDNFKIAFFKKISSTMYLKSKFKIFWNKGRLEEFKKDILAIDDKFDCVQYIDDFLVFSKAAFEQIFGFQNEYTTLCERNINTIESLGIIENIDILRVESEKITIKKKFSRITEENIDWFQDHFKNNRSKILYIIDKVNLDMQVVNNKLIIGDVSELIHLIQNDYLRSEIDDERFVTEQKKRI